ncbi:hypothetical protein ACFV1C_11385, partial [Streptomyces sp. NPDC059605]|uniref:hypothetical protein n=1 Tax=Streptomyces sp. NPDC059605 TaxID=3346882 RepID=UPI003689B7F2
SRTALPPTTGRSPPTCAARFSTAARQSEGEGMPSFFAEWFGGRQPARVGQFVNPSAITDPSYGEHACQPRTCR